MRDLISRSSLSQLKTLMKLSIPVFPQILQQVPAASMKERGLKAPFFLVFFFSLFGDGLDVGVFNTLHSVIPVWEAQAAWAPIMLPWSWALQSGESCCCHPWSNTCSQSPGFVFLHQHFSWSLYGTHLFMLYWQASQDKKPCICPIKYVAAWEIMK